MSNEFPDINIPGFNSQKIIRVYTDGGYSRKRTVGACSFVVVEGDRTIIHSDSCGYTKSTSNRMEIQAVIDGLSWVRENMPDYKVVIFSDSKYTLGIPKWAQRWKENGWKTSNNSPVKNRGLIEEYLSEVELANSFSSQWIAGHDGNMFNEMADTLVGIAMDDEEDSIIDDGDHWASVRSDIEDRPLWD